MCVQLAVGRCSDQGTFAGVCVEVVSGYAGHEALLAGVTHKLLHGSQSGANSTAK